MVLSDHPDFAGEVKSITIHDQPFPQPFSRTGKISTANMDEPLSFLLSLTTNLRHFAWLRSDTSGQGQGPVSSMITDNVVAQLSRMSGLRSLVLSGVHALSLSEPNPGSLINPLAASFQCHDLTISMDNIAPCTVAPFVQNNTSLRTLRLSKTTEGDRRGLVQTLLASCHSWHDLRSLSVEAFDHTLDCLLVMLRHCVVRLCQ